MNVRSEKFKAPVSDPVNTGYLACSLLRVCGAAANFADDNEGYPAGKHMHGYIAQVLKHAEELVGEAVTALELELQGKGDVA